MKPRKREPGIPGSSSASRKSDYARENHRQEGRDQRSSICSARSTRWLRPFYGRGRDTYFEVVTDENKEQIQLHLPNPYHPPKKFVLPQIQRMMRMSFNGKVQIEPTYEEKKRAIFGIRSCDVAGIHHLDRIFLGGSLQGHLLRTFRKNLFLVNVVCTEPECRH